VDNHCEAAQPPEGHDQFAFLRGQVVHHCPRRYRPIRTAGASRKGPSASCCCG
jgi:hypothetical protein